MKFLKVTLGAVYVILIILLLLTNLKSCVNSFMNTTQRTETETDTTTAAPQEVSEQTQDAVEQAQNTGNTGNLKVTLLWDFYGDIDLHVIQPNGTEIFFNNKQDPSTGGALDVDNKNGGEGSAENIYWPSPEKGKYQVSLVYYQPSERNRQAEAGVCTVVVFQQGKEPQTYEVEMSNVKEQKQVTTINIE